MRYFGHIELSFLSLNISKVSYYKSIIVTGVLSDYYLYSREKTSLTVAIVDRMIAKCSSNSSIRFLHVNYRNRKSASQNLKLLYWRIRLIKPLVNYMVVPILTWLWTVRSLNIDRDADCSNKRAVSRGFHHHCLVEVFIYEWGATKKWIITTGFYRIDWAKYHEQRNGDKLVHVNDLDRLVGNSSQRKYNLE